MNPLPGDLFARRLKQERERIGISQAELARRIASILDTNVDPSAVTRIEQQIRAVRLDEAVAAAQALDVPLGVLLDDDPSLNRHEQLERLQADLALAQRRWDAARLEVQRLMRAIQIVGDGVDPRQGADQPGQQQGPGTDRIEIPPRLFTDPDA